VFLAAVQAGLWTLAVVGVLSSVIGAFYYLRIVKVMYFEEANDAFDARAPSISFVAGASAIATASFLLYAAPLIGAAEAAAKGLFR